MPRERRAFSATALPGIARDHRANLAVSEESLHVIEALRSLGPANPDRDSVAFLPHLVVPSIPQPSLEHAPFVRK